MTTCSCSIRCAWTSPCARPALARSIRGNCGNPVMGAHAEALHQPLGRLPPGRQSLDNLRIELWAGRRRRLGEQDAWLESHLLRDAAEPAPTRRREVAPTLVDATEIPLEVEIVPTLDEALPPVRSAEVDEALRRALAVGESVRGPTLSLPLPGEPVDPRLDDLGVALEVTLLRDGNVHGLRKLHACTETVISTHDCTAARASCPRRPRGRYRARPSRERALVAAHPELRRGRPAGSRRRASLDGHARAHPRRAPAAPRRALTPSRSPGLRVSSANPVARRHEPLGAARAARTSLADARDGLGLSYKGARSSVRVCCRTPPRRLRQLEERRAGAQIGGGTGHE